MDRRLNRRQFGERILMTGVALAGSANLAYATDVLNSKPTGISLEASNSLYPLTQRINSNINPEKNDNLPVGYNTQAFSETIIKIAYLEGGLSRAEQIAQYIDQNSLILKATAGTIGFAGGTFNYHSSPPTMSFNPNAVRGYGVDPKVTEHADLVVRHEAYHLIQFVRDPEFMKNYHTKYKYSGIYAVGALQTYGIGRLLGLLAGEIEGVAAAIKNKQISHRSKIPLIAGVIGGIAVSPLALLGGLEADAYISPVEAQAYIQTSGLPGIPPALPINEYLKHLNGQYFTKLQPNKV